MTITTENILNSNITLLECSLPKYDSWFDNGEDSLVKENEFAFFDIEIDGNTIQFSVAVDLEATCERTNSGGDGYINENFDSIDNIEFELNIYEPYSEDAEIGFNLTDSAVYNKLINFIKAK